MQQRYDAYSTQLNQAWQRLFVFAILLTALPAFTGAPQPLTASATTVAVYAFDEQQHYAPQSQIEKDYRSNPHPPLAAATTHNRLTTTNLPHLAFTSLLNVSLKAQPYQVLPITNALSETSWVNNDTRANWQHLEARLSKFSNTKVNPLIALFQPVPKPEPKQWVIVLDAGHGGSDPGAKAHNGLIEKELTLDIAQRTSRFLSEQDNVSVVLTRDSDHGMSRWSRVNKVKRSNADVVVSLHFNHLPQHDINLVETYYAGPRNIMESQAKQLEKQGKPPVMKMGSHKNYSFTKKSEHLANIMQKRVYNEVRLDNPLVADAGVKQETLFILTRSFTPGVLIELSCLSNKLEAENLNDEAYRTRLAASLADGIRDYLHSNPDVKAELAI